MESLKSKSANLLFSGTFFVAVHMNIPRRKIKLAKPALDVSSFKIKFSKKIIKAMNDEQLLIITNVIEESITVKDTVKDTVEA